MSIEDTRNLIERYLDAEHADISTLADDVEFTIMATGEKQQGPAAVLQMMDYFYRIAFDATADPKNVVFADKHAIFEGDFVGKHIGEFAGIPATRKDVRVPLCVVYDIDDNQIKRGRVYFELPALFQQLGVDPGAGK